MSHSRNSHLIDFNTGLLTKDSAPIAYSDGATTNRAIVYGPFDAVYNPRGWLAGAKTLEICGWVDVPNVNPSAVAYLFSLSSNTTGVVSNNLEIQLRTNGDLFIRASGASYGSDFRIFGMNFRPIYSGQRIFVRIILTQGTNDPIVWVNGVNVSLQFTLFLAGTPPNWLDANLNSTYHLVGFNWPSGNAPVIIPILGTLTEAEALSVRTTGTFPSRIVNGGHSNFLPSLLVSSPSFEDGVSTLPNPINASVSNVSTFARTGTRSHRAVSTLAVNGYVQPGRIASAPSQLGLQFNVEAWVYIPSGQSGAAGNIANWQSLVLNADNNSGWSQGVGINQPIVFDSWFRMRRENLARITGSGGGIVTIFTGVWPALGELYIDDIKAELVGALQLPSVNPTQVVSDATVLGTNSGLLIGGSTNCSCREGEFTNVISWNGTHEAKRIFGSAGRVHNGNIRILSIVTKATVASSGSGLTVGTTTSNNRYVTANTFTTAKKVHTLANVLPASTAVNDCDFLIDPDTANYTGAITVTVRYEMLSFNV
jgi:hypothetical protein